MRVAAPSRARRRPRPRRSSAPWRRCWRGARAPRRMSRRRWRRRRASSWRTCSKAGCWPAAAIRRASPRWARSSPAPPRCPRTSASAPTWRRSPPCATTTTTSPRRASVTLLRLHPRDPLALHAAHSFDYITGDTARLRDRVAALLPFWTERSAGLSRPPGDARLRPRGVRRACPRRARGPRRAGDEPARCPRPSRAGARVRDDRARRRRRALDDGAPRRLERRQRGRDALLVAPVAVPPCQRTRRIAPSRSTTSASAPAARSRSPT